MFLVCYEWVLARNAASWDLNVGKFVTRNNSNFETETIMALNLLKDFVSKWQQNGNAWRRDGTKKTFTKAYITY